MRMKLELPGEADRLPEAFAFLQAAWQATGLPEAQLFPFELSLEEVFMNVAMHGGHAGRPATVTLEFECSGAETILSVGDDGPAFDPLSLPTPDVQLSLEERGVGGLGVFLVREMMDSVTYQRREGRNVLRMSKRLG
jgi:anti-sigma regulatory factor (Ser/Thr protein kinase)